jgi:hypothetical protein
VDVHDGGLIASVRPAKAGVGTVSTDLELGGSEGQVRLAFEHGKVSPFHTLFYSKSRSASDHLDALELERAEWLEALDHPDPRPGAGNSPVQRSAEEKFEAYREEVVNLPSNGPASNRCYMARRRLDEKAAHELDQLLALRKLHARMCGANDDKLRAYDDAFEQVLLNPRNRVPEKVTVYEVDSEALHLGLDLAVTARTGQRVLSTMRNLNELIAPTAHDLAYCGS